MKALLPVLFIFAGVVQTSDAHAQTKAAFPYGVEWSGNRYGTNSPWFSVGGSIGAQLLRFSNEQYLDAGATATWSIESRYHTSPTLSFMVGLHGDRVTQTGGSSVTATYTGASKVSNDRYLVSGDTVSVNYSYQARSGHVGMVLGADIGLIEREYWHVQAGPRVGFARYKSNLTFEIDTDGIDDSEIDQDLSGGTGAFSDPMLGLSLRIGAFPSSAVEVGIELHGSAFLGLGDSTPDGLYGSGLSTVPGAGLYTTVHL